MKIMLKSAVFVLLGLAVAIVPLMAGGAAEPEPAPLAVVASDGESPVLRARVDAGELPPVEERLPLNPKVVDVYEEIGQYGGTWRHGLVGAGSSGRMDSVIQWERLARYDRDYQTIVPSLAERIDANDDATEYVFHLRKGVKWSDGHPFSADDIMFWYEDVHLNPSLASAGWDNPPTVVKIDDHTVAFRFPRPRGMFLQADVAFIRGSRNGWLYTNYPRHYLEQFHADYNPNIDELVAASEYADWVELFESKVGQAIGGPGIERWQNTDLPTLNAWVITTGFGVGERVVAERNPYYWKVDAEGNQLPYIDRVVFDMYEDSEVLVLRALSGQIDHRDNIDGVFGTLDAKAVFFDNMDRGDYRLTTMRATASTELTLWLNMTSKNPVLREIFSNKNFRIGVSHAIDRQDVIDTVYVGQGIPYQVAPREGSAFYDAELALQYTQHDIALANSYLDEAGYTQRDGQGYRRGPDGNRISFNVNVIGDRQPNVDGMEIVSSHLAKVGIDMQVRSMDGSLFWTSVGANEFDALVWSGPGGYGIEVLLDAHGWFPIHANAWYATAWGLWNVNPNGPNAEEPPAYVKEQIGLYNQMLTTADPDEQASLMNAILAITKDQFYSIGINLRADQFGIAKNNFRNLPETVVHPGRMPYQYFFDQSR